MDSKKKTVLEKCSCVKPSVKLTQTRRTIQEVKYHRRSDIPDESESPQTQASSKGERTACARARNHAAKILESDKFDMTVGFVIIVNSMTIGVEQTYRINRKSTQVLDILEHFFLTVYLVELLLRFFVNGFKAFRDHWVQFDLFLVATSVITQWVLAPLIGSDVIKAMGPWMVMRTARLARLARTLRLVFKFRSLWMLVRGLLSSARTMCCTLVLLIIILYMFSCVGLELLRLDKSYLDGSMPPAYAAVVQTYFESLPSTMITLVQFVCMDSIGSIYRPLIEENWALVIYFMTVIVVVAIVIMNIVTAVLVNGALEQANQDKAIMRDEQEKKKIVLMKSLYEMFQRLDKDGSGRIDRHEILHASEEDKVLLHEFMELSDPMEVFDFLDIDGGGALDIDEFCHGLYESAISKTPIEVLRMDKRMQAMSRQQNELYKDLRMVVDFVKHTLTNQVPHESRLPSNYDMPATSQNHDSTKDTHVNEEQPVDIGSFSNQAIESRLPPWKPIIGNEVAADSPSWVKDFFFELQRLTDYVQRLDSSWQTSFGSMKLNAVTPAAKVPTSPRCSLKLVPDVPVETPARSPNVIYDKVSVSDAILASRQTLKARVDEDDAPHSPPCVETDQMSAPYEADSFGVTKFPRFPNKKICASHKSNDYSNSDLG